MTGAILYEMIKINGPDNRRINHALKVFGYAQCIADREGFCERTAQCALCAAALHDIAIRFCEKKYGSCAGPLQEKEGPSIARPILEKYTADDGFIDRVLYIIAHHHSYDKADGDDFQAVIEADLIVNAQEGDISKNAFDSAVKRFFKTGTGKELARTVTAFDS